MKTTINHPEVIDQIMKAGLPSVVNANLRGEPRKVIAANIRDLLKRLGIQHVSVTTPNYSMAQSVDVTTPDFFPWHGEHEALHAKIDQEDRTSDKPWTGYGSHCEFCRKSQEAKDRLESIILAAYPDLADRSDSQSDYFDYRFVIR